MFRPMRRKRQVLALEQCDGLLASGSNATLAVVGDGGWPYAVPVSYVYSGGKIYLHSAPTGHKVDAIRRCDRVSLCVIGQDQVVPEEFTTYFRSVIVFGRARILESEADCLPALRLLGRKYSPGDEAGLSAEISKNKGRLVVIEITPEHISGKEAIELVRARKG